MSSKVASVQCLCFGQNYTLLALHCMLGKWFLTTRIFIHQFISELRSAAAAAASERARDLLFVALKGNFGHVALVISDLQLSLAPAKAKPHLFGNLGPRAAAVSGLIDVVDFAVTSTLTCFSSMQARKSPVAALRTRRPAMMMMIIHLRLWCHHHVFVHFA